MIFIFNILEQYLLLVELKILTITILDIFLSISV